MTKKDILGIVKTSAILLLICLVITALLAVTNKYTKKPIADIAKKTEQETMQKIVPAKSYEQKSVDYNNETYTVNIAKDGEDVKGYVFSLKSKGYGGDISVMTGIGTDGKVIAVSIVDASNETPGLGQNVTKESFYSQYSGKTDNIEVVKSNADENQITAVTGATISSKAVTRAVNTALEVFYNSGSFGDFTNGEAN